MSQLNLLKSLKRDEDVSHPTNQMVYHYTYYLFVCLSSEQFDQSGRATEGLAFIFHHSESYAADAIKAFNGASAKGQPIGLRYEFGMPLWVCSSLGLVPNKGPSSLPNKASVLLGQINHDRLTKRFNPSLYKTDRFKNPRSSFPPTGPRGSGGGRSGMKSAKDLDKELEAFMDTTPQNDSKSTESKNAGDVQMAE
ncbi:uncharacterized protein MELLADRAFT_96284 [Melampsora larici-populina 98AG31]|uniref:Chromatin target of PRMT1 protein C-terminal domain-containing protein n=1 Tax=Melampsora larici-populina (strain 98AG31 / pathotype 3-4-7) TaxID=747676 RepID=F4RE79_MELLP|nr:uncharacterized protein MELLADRAFT_96284 [Melampsora larici-populina 98AG31]EGG09319.1 hypothetical protein MELLADRAFT_96284 [Melampsora larici-populina 98AG31]